MGKISIKYLSNFSYIVMRFDFLIVFSMSDHCYYSVMKGVFSTLSINVRCVIE